MRLINNLLLAALLAMSWSTFAAATLEATVYKDPGCGCCGRYISYLEANGFTVNAVDTADVDAIKDAHHVPFPMRSCHTMLIDGYVVEGHVPAAAIHKLLESHPKIAGIALPGMPPTSPGMGPEQPGGLKVYLLGDDDANPQVFSVE